jgi:hypothetical protein
MSGLGFIYEFLAAVHRQDETAVRGFLADTERLPALVLALATLDRRDSRRAEVFTVRSNTAPSADGSRPGPAPSLSGTLPPSFACADNSATFAPGIAAKPQAARLLAQRLALASPKAAGIARGPGCAAAGARGAGQVPNATRWRRPDLPPLRTLRHSGMARADHEIPLDDVLELAHRA